MTCGAHDAFVKLFHLFPRGSDRAFLPAAVSADRRTPEKDSIVRLPQRLKPVGGSAAAAAGKRAEAVGCPCPEGAVGGLVLRTNLRMYFARVGNDMLDALFDRHVDQTGHLSIAVEA